MAPLAIRPARAVRPSLLGEGRPWQPDRNIRRGPLRNKTQEHGWGFGVQAPVRIVVRASAACPGVPHAGRTGRPGPQRRLRPGPCLSEPMPGIPLYRSELLIGSSKRGRYGQPGPCGPADRPQTLVLVADAAAREGPPVRSPGHPRHARLDRADIPLGSRAAEGRCAEARRPRSPRDGWTVKLEGGGAPRWQTGFEEIEPGMWNCFAVISTDGRPLTLARQQAIPATADGLLLPCDKFPAAAGATGVPRGRAPGPLRFALPRQRLPLFVSLKSYSGRKIHLEIVYQPGSGGELLDVQSLGLGQPGGPVSLEAGGGRARLVAVPRCRSRSRPTARCGSAEFA